MKGLNRSDTQDKGFLSLSNLLTRGEELRNHYVLVQCEWIGLLQSSSMSL
jgi:hypothetical protein